MVTSYSATQLVSANRPAFGLRQRNVLVCTQFLENEGVVEVFPLLAVAVEIDLDSPLRPFSSVRNRIPSMRMG